MNNTILREKYEIFSGDTLTALPGLLEMDNELLPEIFHDFKYPICSYPVLLSAENTESQIEICETIPRLLARIPELYFENDKQQIADFYYGGDMMATEIALMCLQKDFGISSRLDLILTEDGFKVLESNMGSSIGGTEFENFEPLIKRLHPALFAPNHDKEYYFRPTQSIYMAFLVDEIMRMVAPISKEVNIFLAIKNDTEVVDQVKVDQFFDSLLKIELERRGLTGQAFSGTVEELKFQNQQLSVEGKPVHAVLGFEFGVNLNAMNLFRAIAMGKVYCPDHMGTLVMRDKRSLALLYELALKGKFEKRENELILECIPWATTMAEKQVTFMGEEWNLVELLKNSKNDFVIKISDGLQGDDVFVGKCFNPEQWNEIISNAMSKKNFVAQQYCESIELLAPDVNSKWCLHKLVWGAFGFGKKYGGVWVRMSAVYNNSEVINSATGAVEAIVYESY